MEPIKKNNNKTNKNQNKTKQKPQQLSIEKMEVINDINFIISFRIILSMSRE